jgi:hypothetical protein
MDRVVIYTTAFNAQDSVLAFLRKEGCDAVAFDEPSLDTPAEQDTERLMICDFVGPLAYIAVPREQVAAAINALGKFRESTSRRVAIICETLRFQVLVASVVTIAVAVALLINNPFDLFFPILFVVWLGTFIFVANLGRINAVLARQRTLRMWRRPPHD